MTVLVGSICLFVFVAAQVPERSVEPSADELTELSGKLEHVSRSETVRYKLRDDRGMGMDCLKVFQSPHADDRGIYFGVYHHMDDGCLLTQLARSTDLEHWEHLTTLDKHASQPAIHVTPDGQYLLAYEHDEPNSVWIRIRHYADLESLCSGAYSREFDIDRSLAPTAEGTPSFEAVSIGSGGLDSSSIQLRFHYYKDQDVDQLARGTLTNFSTWTAKPADELNRTLRASGWLGNLGDRDKLNWGSKSYYLQEVQAERGQWGTWRLALCDDTGNAIHILRPQTHQGSVAFSNPHATWVTDQQGRRRLVVTLFLHSAGNPPAERGCLLYVIHEHP